MLTRRAAGLLPRERRFTMDPPLSKKVEPIEKGLLHTIPQLPYNVLYHLILRWLATLNRRHLQASLPLVARYVAGLLWVRGAATCSAIAAGGRASHDALNRLLIGPCLRGVLQRVALSLVDRYT